MVPFKPVQWGYILSLITSGLSPNLVVFIKPLLVIGIFNCFFNKIFTKFISSLLQGFQSNFLQGRSVVSVITTEDNIQEGLLHPFNVTGLMFGDAIVPGWYPKFTDTSHLFTISVLQDSLASPHFFLSFDHPQPSICFHCHLICVRLPVQVISTCEAK